MLKWIKKILQNNEEGQEEVDIEINKEEVPKHIAVIMDGNGRWAEKKDLVRTQGHKKGVSTLKKIVKLANQLGVEYFTAYAFSTENWKRPQEEVEFLMDLFKEVFAQELETFKKENIKVNIIGYKDRLPQSVSKKANRLVAETKDNTGLELNIALDYGGQAEIVESTKKIIEDVQAGNLSTAELTEEKFSDYLYTAGQKDVDLLIRPGGEKRISNFLLWQIAYSELYFTATYWPDFKEEEFKAAIKEYQKRNRRFGGIKGK
ncbi:isoprenyl transferase [Halanaerobacter jeridensis]|uniref:Isoprenyl transferase n=1 Tax=Halanaerobacter jeridensis TaxID=706427 RepID=A0A938XN50_9FIRM|nr:isoprenyl transferase [Halanaerobacter jeridensis]MBM7555373.1 undecaprenyl diphosphate synthase [Halanaerobacter jeridensis]